MYSIVDAVEDVIKHRKEIEFIKALRGEKKTSIDNHVETELGKEGRDTI